MRIWGAVVLAVILNAALISDSMTGKIRNGLILSGLAAGLMYRLWSLGTAGLGVYAGGVLLTLAMTIPLFALGAIGAGDGKLLAVVGGFLGIEAMPRCLLLTFLLGAVQAIFKMVWQGSLSRRLAFLGEYLTRTLREGRIRPYGQDLMEEEAVIHLSASILFATLICLIGGVI